MTSANPLALLKKPSEEKAEIKKMIKTTITIIATIIIVNLLSLDQVYSDVTLKSLSHISRSLNQFLLFCQTLGIVDEG